MNKSNEITDLRQEWERLSTSEVESILQTELSNPERDDDVVVILLHILEAREPHTPLTLTPGEEIAVRRYREKIRKRSVRTTGYRRWLSVAASLLLVVFLFSALLPQQAEAETFWEMISRWKESVLQFLNPGDKVVAEEYTFQTNHPGLQQVYDAVSELGIEEPVVPMWIPEEYILTEVKEKDTPKLSGMYFDFSDDKNYLIYKIEVYKNEVSHEYYKDDTYSEMYEVDGVTYNITRNNDWWVAVWTKDNIECSIFMDCQEETLRRILDSIYTMEDN